MIMSVELTILSTSFVNGYAVNGGALYLSGASNVHV